MMMVDWCKRLAGGALVVAAAVGAAGADGDDFFEGRIRPLLVEHCYECHSANARKLKAGLHLDSRQGLLQGGESGPAIVSGQPEQSRLIRAVEYEDVDLQMPPRQRLGATQVEDLRQWVKMGAPWPGEAGKPQVTNNGFDLAKRKEEFWAWQPVVNHSPPKISKPAWAHDAIDQFVAARLEAAGLQPGPDADRLTLLRRLSFDLIGLPPTPEGIQAFLADRSDMALAREVDRLLDSRHFGERWARHWLDMVRYSETLGHEFDYTIHNAWRYRDYVIRAFNADVPYDRFMMEHVAGDLLPEPRRNPSEGFNESVIGTAFYWFGQQKHSPVDIRQETADTIDNQIDVLTKTFMGMTVSCARCHDHKFDAISTVDYYALFGVLGSSRYSQRAIDEDMAVAPVRDRAVKLIAAMHQVAKNAIASEELASAGEYLRAAFDLSKAPATDHPDEGIVFEDFENPLAGWMSSGDAFSGPLRQSDIGSYQGDVNARGNGFINSHNARIDGQVKHSDSLTGTLTSPAFILRKRYVHLLVGGGAHQGKTCVNLLVDGEVVASLTGRNSNRMAPARFDAQPWRGREARIEAVDMVKGGWGNIGLDHIVFSDREAVFDAEPEARPSDEMVAEMAAARHLERDTLGRWVKFLQALPELRVPADEEPAAKYTVFADFAKGSAAGWYPEGAAWRVPEKTGDFVPNLLGRGRVMFLGAGWWHSGRLGAPFQGALRSPTFEVTNDFVHVLVAGNEARINAVVDNFTVIKNPIWGGLKRDVKNESPHWLTFDLRMVKGHHAWLEFLDTTVGDPGGRSSYARSGWVAVRRVLFSDESRPPRAVRPLALTSKIDATHVGLIAGSIGKAVNALAAAWGGATVAIEADELGLVNALADAGLLLAKTGKGEALRKLIAEHRALLDEVPEPRRIPGMSDGNGVDEHVFVRGNPRNKGKVAPRAFLTALGDGVRFGPQSSGRLQVARDLVDPANPLPTRVIVNKVWHHLFGRGIVATVDNFGVLGDRPTHPELLDHLAHWFREDGWSLKRLIRRIVLSHSYQLSSATEDRVAEELDPKNRLLHRANVKRLEGEVIRDAMLRVSGSLKVEMFGEPVPVHLTSFMEGRGRPGASGPLDGGNRRSIYTAVRRNFLSPMMLAFDTPLPATTVGRRPSSNVPAQALILMNDKLVGELAERWATKLESTRNNTELVTEMYERAFGRLPSETELSAGREFLDDQEKLHEGDDARRKALADLGHVLFNVKEFVFLN